MNTKSNLGQYVLGILVFVSLLIGVVNLSKPSQVVERVTDQNGVVHVGSGASQQEFNRKFFLGGLTQGGSITATSSTASTYTTVAGDFAGQPTVISWTPNVNTTISLSSTSTMAYVPNVGDTAVIYFRNASTTAASSVTFAAVGANQDLQMAEATGGDLVLNGLDWEKVTLIRTSTYNVTYILDEMTEAD